MATGVCIYCGRTLDSGQLLDKAGKYRCRNEQDCLDYQTREESTDPWEDPDYLSNWIKSSLGEAERRVASYRETRETPEASEEAKAALAWFKAAVDGLAAQFRDRVAFQEEKGGYAISFHDGDRKSPFRVRIGRLDESRFALTVAKAEAPAGDEDLYGEFIYKSYPASRREEVIQDLSVLFLAFAGEAGAQSALLREFRREIEARGCCE